MNPLQIAQIIVTFLLIASILLQAGESGMFSAGGLMAGGEHYHTRRGVEKVLFYGTFLWLALFLVLSLVAIR